MPIAIAIWIAAALSFNWWEDKKVELRMGHVKAALSRHQRASPLLPEIETTNNPAQTNILLPPLEFTPQDSMIRAPLTHGEKPE